MKMRVACIWIPDWPLQALLRSTPSLCGLAVAVIDARDRVVCVSPEAKALGVRVGLTSSQAQGISELTLLRRLSSSALESARQALGEAAARFSPCVETSQASTEVAWVALEVGDLGRLFDSEKANATALWAQTSKAGLEARVCIANSPTVARIVARVQKGVTVIPEEEERARLAPLPLSALRGAFLPNHALVNPCANANELDGALAELSSFGIHTLGELANLPRKRLAVRLGAIGVALCRMASAEDTTVLCPTPCPHELTEALDLDDPIDHLEALSFILRGLLDRMARRLSVQGLAMQEFVLGLRLYPRGIDERRIALAAPSREVATLVELTRLVLAEKPPLSAVTGMVLKTTPTRARPTQLALFSPSGPSPEQLSMTLARLSVLCSARDRLNLENAANEIRMGRATIPDTHLPGAMGMAPFALSKESSRGVRIRELEAGKQASPSWPLATHALRPPRPAEVLLSGARPNFVRARGIAGRIIEYGGPYRFAWGFEQPFGRDYYDIELDCGIICRIFHELRTGDWFLDARYE